MYLFRVSIKDDGEQRENVKTMCSIYCNRSDRVIRDTLIFQFMALSVPSHIPIGHIVRTNDDWNQNYPGVRSEFFTIILF